MFLPDLVLRHNQKRLAGRNPKTGDFRDCGCGTGDRVWCPPAFRIPISRLQQRLFSWSDEVSSFFLQLIEKAIVNGGLNYEVSVSRTTRSVVVRFADSRVSGGLLNIRGLIDNHRGVS